MSYPFHDRLSDANAPLIAEIKPHSPKLGPLLGGRRVADVAQDYAEAGAPCLSVTTGAWHGGNPAMICDMARTGLPVLRKDFITSERHLTESLDAGASAVLLTCTLAAARRCCATGRGGAAAWADAFCRGCLGKGVGWDWLCRLVPSLPSTIATFVTKRWMTAAIEHSEALYQHGA